MRVFQLCAGAAKGGAETAFVDFCIAQHQAGYDVTPVTRNHPLPIERLRAAGMTPVALPFGGPFDFRTRPALKKLVREKKPQIVMTWLQRAAKFAPRPAPDLPPFKLIGRLGGYYDVKYYKGMDHLVTITPDIKRHLVARGVPAERVTHINNFADVEPFVEPVTRADLATPEGAFICLLLSRLHPAKGIDTFLKAMARLPEHVYGWIAGDGPDRAKLEVMAAEFGLQHRVRFLGWRTDRAALLAASDCLVFPSRYEPFGSTFVQAWAAEKPLVTTAAQGPSQFVRDGQDGLMVPIEDEDALALAIQNLMDDPALVQSLVKNGRARFEAEFTQNACLARYGALYESL